MVTLEARAMTKTCDASRLEGIQTVTDTPTADSDGARMTRLRAMVYELGIRNDKPRDSGSWEQRGEDLKTLRMTQENEDKDKDQGDKMGRNENTGLMCDQ